MRMPTPGEALQLAQTFDIPNADELEFFWTDERTVDPDHLAGTQQLAFIADDSGRLTTSHVVAEAKWETLCVSTPTN